MGVANSSGRIPLESAWDALPLFATTTSSWAPGGTNCLRAQAEEKAAAQRRADAAAGKAKLAKPPGYLYPHERKPEHKATQPSGPQATKPPGYLLPHQRKPVRKEAQKPDLLSYGLGASKWAVKRDAPQQQQTAAVVASPVAAVVASPASVAPVYKFPAITPGPAEVTEYVRLPMPTKAELDECAKWKPRCN